MLGRYKYIAISSLSCRTPTITVVGTVVFYYWDSRQALTTPPLRTPHTQFDRYHLSVRMRHIFIPHVPSCGLGDRLPVVSDFVVLLLLSLAGKKCWAAVLAAASRGDVEKSIYIFVAVSSTESDKNGSLTLSAVDNSNTTKANAAGRWSPRLEDWMWEKKICLVPTRKW